jgi:hypothetical protein
MSTDVACANSAETSVELAEGVAKTKLSSVKGLAARAGGRSAGRRRMGDNKPLWFMAVHSAERGGPGWHP